MKKLLLPTAVVATALFAFSAVFAAPALADTDYKAETTIKKDSDGDANADTKVEATDEAGTTTKTEQKTDVDVDNNGDYTKTTETTTEKDPRGLFNSSKTTTKNTVKKKGRKIKHKHVKKVNGRTMEDIETVTPVNR
jgi:hypothetical protein